MYRKGVLKTHWKHKYMCKNILRKSKSEQRDHLADQANEQIIICSFWVPALPTSLGKGS